MAILQNKSLNPKLLELAKYLISEQGNPGEIAARKVGATPIMGSDGTFGGFNWGDVTPSDAQLANAEKILKNTTQMQDISNGVSPMQLGQLGLGAMGRHPLKAIALGSSIAGNLGGLTDNDKMGGQIGGLALGGLGSYALNAMGVPMNPYTMAMLTSGAGNLGALFDKLRARKEMEQSQPQPQPQFRR